MGLLKVSDTLRERPSQAAVEESRWEVLVEATCPGEGLEAGSTGTPGGEPVTDVYVFACLASISSSSGNCTHPIGKLFVSWLLPPLSTSGYQADELQFGDIVGTTGKEKLYLETSRPDRCKSKVLKGSLPPRGVWLFIHINLKPVAGAEASSGYGTCAQQRQS